MTTIKAFILTEPERRSFSDGNSVVRVDAISDDNKLLDIRIAEENDRLVARIEKDKFLLFRQVSTLPGVGAEDSLIIKLTDKSRVSCTYDGSLVYARVIKPITAIIQVQ